MNLYNASFSKESVSRTVAAIMTLSSVPLYAPKVAEHFMCPT